VEAITDIWFYTGLPLIELGAAPGLAGIDPDGENYWEWIIGDLVGAALDITRTHTVPPRTRPRGSFALADNGLSRRI